MLCLALLMIEIGALTHPDAGERFTTSYEVVRQISGVTTIGVVRGNFPVRQTPQPIDVRQAFRPARRRFAGTV